MRKLKKKHFSKCLGDVYRRGDLQLMASDMFLLICKKWLSYLCY